MDHFQLVKPDIFVEARQSLSNAFLGVKSHAYSVGVARVQTDTQSIFLFHSTYDLSNVGKVGAHAVPLSCHVLQQYPGILLDALTAMFSASVVLCNATYLPISWLLL